jgi:hypothetical protein
MTNVGTGEEAVADGAATCDARGADGTTPPAQSPIDLQQLALFLASQLQFQQPPPPNHHGGPVSVADSGHPFGMVGEQPFSTFGDASPFGSFSDAPPENLGGYGAVGSLGARAAAGGLGSSVGGGHFSRGIASPPAPPPVSRTVTFVRDTAGSDAPSGDALLRQFLDRIAALESRRDPASLDVSGGRPSSPTPSEASQASTPSTTCNNVTSLDHALGLPDDEFNHAPDKHLSKKWVKLLSSSKLTLDQKSTAAELNAILCLGLCLRHLSYATDQLLASGAGHDDARRAADEDLAVTVDAEQELASILAHFSVLCSKTMGQHTGIIREAARIAREAELGDCTSIEGSLCVADRHVADILTSAFKKLSDQDIKDMYIKDKSSKKAGPSPADEEPAADLSKELEVTKKTLQ